MTYVKYMHTMDGRPATFDGDQICYATFYGKPNVLRNSLKEIRADQRATLKFRQSHGFHTDKFCYGHLRFST